MITANRDDKCSNKEAVGEKKCLEEHGISLQGASQEENIDGLIERMRESSFKVLVMGRFSSGKSAFINVLLGGKLLPEKSLPTTALITEIYYGRKSGWPCIRGRGGGKAATSLLT